MKSEKILLSISMLVSGKEDMEKSLQSLMYFKEAIPCEIILVDTGCNVEQRVLVDMYGDKVIEFTWCNDFAAARNAGLREAQGEWFLYLDDDEWFENPVEIIEFFKSGEYREYNCASYVVRNYANFQGTIYDDSYPSRMVKLTPETKFVGKIHEYLEPFELPKKEFTDFVHHYGYVFKDGEAKKKHGMRNIQPLLEMRKEHPGDPRWMLQLAQEYFAVKDYEESIKVCVEGLNEWQALMEYVKFAPAHVGALYAYILISYECMGRYEEMEEWLEKVLAHPLMKLKTTEPTVAFYYMTAARLYSLTDRHELCRDYYQKYRDCARKYVNGRRRVEEGTAGITTGVFQEHLTIAVILMSVASLIRVEDFALAEEAFYSLDWNDSRLLHQHKWEQKMLDACCDVAEHPLWKRILKTLVSREGGLDEMFSVFLTLEEKHEEQNAADKLTKLREVVLGVEDAAWKEKCQQHYAEKAKKEFAENWIMDLELAYGILDVLQTIWDAVKQMKDAYVAKDIETFNALSMDVWEGLVAVQEIAKAQVPEGSRIRLADACTCGMESLKDIKLLVLTHPEKVEWKLEYELAPIVETTAMQFYYWGIVEKHPEAREEFLKFVANTETFELLKKTEKEREYACDLVICVIAYNKLEYTMKCVQSILENLPEGINTELVLYNHGSSDATKAYFESIENARVINIAVNGAMSGVNFKAFCRGRYYLNVSNDIVIGKNAIANLWRCVTEHKEYGYVVPSTPAVSNLQTIRADYDSAEGFAEFAVANNLYDERRHEQRTRLCNPLHIMPVIPFLQMHLETFEDRHCIKQTMSFPDDKNSLWMRRNGYKCILAKDAYCHHFGSVTLKTDLGTQRKQQKHYKEGRANFQQKYGIDPWGTGCHYEPELFAMWEFPIVDNAAVLGINCGQGSNSLKVKEILREKGAQGVTLCNVTQDAAYEPDLKGVSDEAYVIQSLVEVVEKTGRKKYNYIVVDDPIQGENADNVVQTIVDAGLEFDELAWRTADGGWQVARWA